MWQTRANVTRLKKLGLSVTDLKVTLRDLDRNIDLASGPLTASEGPDLLPETVREAIRRTSAEGVVLKIKGEGLPWELANLDEEPLGLSERVLVVREPETSPGTGRKLRPFASVLVICANPASAEYPRLANAEAELQSVQKALESPECRRWRVDALSDASFEDLKRKLRTPYDVVHFIGHGDVGATGGFLVFEGSGGHQAVYADKLLPLLTQAGVGMVVLSACSSISVGFRLAEAGVPFVAGMQFPMSDQAARDFSRAFYASLAVDEPVEVAIRQGRSAIRGYGTFWAAPVLIACPNVEIVEAPPKPAPEGLEERPFIGRVEERAQVRALLERPEVRVVTVTGIGGMGKTRLARQLAFDLEAAYQDRVWFVPCDSLESRDEIVAAVANALGAEVNQASEEGIAELLAGPPALLVLDCFEKLVEHRSILATMLAAAPRAQVLVTSRCSLDLAQEYEYKLPPMALPRRAETTSDALDLFKQAATQAQETFQLDAKNRATVKTLIQMLEAIPLAIVLAAGQLKHMTLAEILAKVREGQRMAVVRRRASLDPRHDNLVRVLKDSFALLSPAELEAVNALAVFRGGFTEADVDGVLDTGEAFATIRDLRQHSLLASQPSGEVTRYSMLDTVRECIEFLEERAEIPSLDGYRRKHASRFAEEAQELRRKFDADQWPKIRTGFWLEVGNYRAAVAFAIRSGDADLIRQLAGTLYRIFFEVGVDMDFDAAMREAEAAARSANDLALLAELHGLHSERYRREDRIAEMIEHARTRADLCRELGDVEGAADSVLEAADQGFTAGFAEVAQEMIERFSGLDHSRIAKPFQAGALLIQARMSLAQGDMEPVPELIDRATATMTGIGVDRHALYVWKHLAALTRTLGRLDQSESLARRLIRDALDCMHYQPVGQGLFQLASTLEAKGDWEGAAEAIAVTLKIPKSVSSYVRREGLLRWQAFQGTVPEQVLSQASQRVNGDWKAHALRLGHDGFLQDGC